MGTQADVMWLFASNRLRVNMQSKYECVMRERSNQMQIAAIIYTLIILMEGK